MSKNKPVMSHDPLADLDFDIEDARETVSECVPNTQGSVLRLESSLTIREVGEFYGVCQAALECCGPLTFDGGEIEAIDGAGLQLIAACVKQAIEQGREIRWQAKSEALIGAAGVLGLDKLLGLDD